MLKKLFFLSLSLALALALASPALADTPDERAAAAVAVELSRLRESTDKRVSGVERELAELRAEVARLRKSSCAECRGDCRCEVCRCDAKKAAPKEWRWASLPGVGPGWVHSSVPAASEAVSYTPAVSGEVVSYQASPYQASPYQASPHQPVAQTGSYQSAPVVRQSTARAACASCNR